MTVRAALALAVVMCQVPASGHAQDVDARIAGQRQALALPGQTGPGSGEVDPLVGVFAGDPDRSPQRTRPEAEPHERPTDLHQPAEAPPPIASATRSSPRPARPIASPAASVSRSGPPSCPAAWPAPTVDWRSSRSPGAISSASGTRAAVATGSSGLSPSLPVRPIGGRNCADDIGPESSGHTSTLRPCSAPAGQVDPLRLQQRWRSRG